MVTLGVVRPRLVAELPSFIETEAMCKPTLGHVSKVPRSCSPFVTEA